MTTVNVSSRGFLLAAAVGTGIGVALFVTNAVYFGRARNNCQAITRNTSDVMMWLNIILAIIFALLFLWILYRLLVHPQLRQELTQKATTYLTSQPTGVIQPNTVSAQTVQVTTGRGLGDPTARPADLAALQRSAALAAAQ